MFHIVQDNCFKEPHYNKLIEALNRFELDYEVVKLKPFIDHIEFKTERKDVMVWGAIKMARLAKKFDWHPGSFMNERHDYDHYSGIYKDSLFNSDSKVVKYSDKGYPLPPKFFARPTKDSKAFSGKVFTAEEYHMMLGVLKRNNSVKGDFNIQLAPVKPIQAEGRFWVVNGRIITGSLYRQGSRYWLEEVKKDDPMWQFAQDMVSIHQIAEAFVIDICMSKGKYSIMEFGCINCAGFYLADMQKLVESVENMKLW